MLVDKKVAIINLGCKVNKYESDSMADKLRDAGATIVMPDQNADIYIVNTCSVTNVAEKKSRQMLSRAKKNNPNAIVVAAGCYVNANPKLLESMDYVDLMVGNNRKKNIVEVIVQYLTNMDTLDNYIDINDTKEYEEMGSMQADALNHTRAYIKIQDGCNQFCSYCLIPFTRGRVRSRNANNIIEEIEQLAQSGVKEFVLTGIHISSYGVDFDETVSIRTLGDLICAIQSIDSVCRIRLGSLEPRIISSEFLDQIRKCDKLCPHFHLSLQSACNETLKRMNRKYTIEEFMDKCELLRKYYDNPAITTDVIVGFPGETDEEFEVTVTNLKKLNLYELHVFKYSIRSGTVAQKLPNHVDEQEKNKRSERLILLTKQQKRAYENMYVGKCEQVLVEEPIDDLKTNGIMVANIIGTDVKGSITCTGYTKNYIKVIVKGSENILNKIYDVELTGRKED